ncbi:MAG: hypothetical protein MJK14_13395 [Rivularia sp. ALOHA_DT_140]|nr:hypothetical protein [Rivularia sp. ALOHA_DT_140]
MSNDSLSFLPGHWEVLRQLLSKIGVGMVSARGGRKIFYLLLFVFMLCRHMFRLRDFLVSEQNLYYYCPVVNVA